MSKSSKAPTVVCSSCGTENAISTPFCRQCGDRLYKGGAAPVSSVDEGSKSLGRAVRSFLSSLLFLVLATALGLALWPLSTADIPVNSSGSLQVETYLDQVERLKASGRELPELHLSQMHLNAFLGQNADVDQLKLLGAVVTQDQILVMANEPLGPLKLSSRLILKPADGSNQEMVPSQLFVGQLPLPLALVRPWTERIISVFGLGVDPVLLDDLRIRSAHPGKLTVGGTPDA